MTISQLPIPYSIQDIATAQMLEAHLAGDLDAFLDWQYTVYDEGFRKIGGYVP